TSVVGKATAGLADTFKQSVNFIGCVAQAVSAGGLRKMNVASGEYFKANPNNVQLKNRVFLFLQQVLIFLNIFQNVEA
ncbi:MAG: hypothetical protein ACYT04_47285, partial [Nostoc sp.]